jgi:hypothetical protein
MSRSFYGLCVDLARYRDFRAGLQAGYTSEGANNAKPKPLSMGPSLMFVHYTIHSRVVVQVLVA